RLPSTSDAPGPIGRRAGFVALAAGSVLILAVGCHRAGPAATVAAGPVWFEDVTDAVGLQFTHDAGPADGRYFLPQVIGSGAALFDYDNDGRLDIYLIQNGGPDGARNRLYHQETDGRFTDASAGSGLDIT